jgi:hypothetical protein
MPTIQSRAVRALPLLPVIAAALLWAGPAAAQSAKPYDGYLCCSMLSDDSWISDLNYDDGSKKVIPAGTPVKFTGFGRWRLLVEINGKKLGIGNDYSRTMTMDDFAAKYVLKQDPRPVLDALPAKLREATLTRKVVRGMTREQVVAALGYPTTTSTPDMSKPLWTYRTRGGDFQVFWSEDGKVDRLFGAPAVREKVWLNE